MKSKYSEKEKLDIIENIGQKYNIKETCKIYNISKSTLYNWKKNYSAKNNSSQKLVF